MQEPGGRTGRGTKRNPRGKGERKVRDPVPVRAMPAPRSPSGAGCRSASGGGTRRGRRIHAFPAGSSGPGVLRDHATAGGECSRERASYRLPRDSPVGHPYRSPCCCSNPRPRTPGAASRRWNGRKRGDSGPGRGNAPTRFPGGNPCNTPGTFPDTRGNALPGTCTPARLLHPAGIAAGQLWLNLQGDHGNDHKHG